MTALELLKSRLSSCKEYVKQQERLFHDCNTKANEINKIIQEYSNDVRDLETSIMILENFDKKPIKPLIEK